MSIPPISVNSWDGVGFTHFYHSGVCRCAGQKLLWHAADWGWLCDQVGNKQGRIISAAWGLRVTAILTKSILLSSRNVSFREGPERHPICPQNHWTRWPGRISIDPTAREDVTLVPVPRECIGYVMGDKSGSSDFIGFGWDMMGSLGRPVFRKFATFISRRDGQTMPDLQVSLVSWFWPHERIDESPFCLQVHTLCFGIKSYAYEFGLPWWWWWWWWSSSSWYVIYIDLHFTHIYMILFRRAVPSLAPPGGRRWVGWKRNCPGHCLGLDGLATPKQIEQ